MSSLLDGLAFQAEEENWLESDGHAEVELHQEFSITFLSFGAGGNLKDPRLSTDFKDAVRHKDWRDAINRE